MNKETSVKFCCVGFQVSVENVGNRGHSMVIGRDSIGGTKVRLQHRVVDAGLEAMVSCAQNTVPLSLVAEMGIQFCPWCGRNVVDHYKRQIQLIDNSSLFISGI
jgi:hypothetical protein